MSDCTAPGCTLLPGLGCENKQSVSQSGDVRLVLAPLFSTYLCHIAKDHSG